MSWIDSKGAGPWSFIPQENKFGYLNNPRWSPQQDAIAFCEAKDLPLDLPNQHKPCGHWHKLSIEKKVIPTGRWVAAMQQPNTPYVYLYDITYKAVIKIDTSTNPVTLTEVFPINATYQLDSNYKVTQKGGFCMDKNGARIWYLFRENCIEGGGPKNNCELIEIDISGSLMKKVKSTIYTGLVGCDYEVFHEAILDGCSDNTYTYWATNEITGRLIKIRNSDHIIVIDKQFNFSPPEEGIHSIDYHANKLYWSYVIGAGWPEDHHIRSDTNFNVEIDNTFACVEGGINQPTWWNLVRILNGYILQHRNYNPSWGYFVKRELDWTCTGFYNDQQYLRNILGVKNGKLFTLQRDNSVSAFRHLYCIDFSDMSIISTSNVSYYTKEKQDEWEKTNVSAMNQQTGVIIIVRYHDMELRNYVACFKADSSLDLIGDVPLDYSVTGNEKTISSEPQVWTMPG